VGSSTGWWGARVLCYDGALGVSEADVYAGKWRYIAISGREAQAPSAPFVFLRPSRRLSSNTICSMYHTWVLKSSRFYSLISSFYGTQENCGAT
jgi:hypothetical protein